MAEVIGYFDQAEELEIAFSDYGYNGSIIEAVEKFDYENSIFFENNGKRLIKGRIRF